MSATMKESRRISSIHGLRGIAAMSVVLYHLTANLEEELAEFMPDITMLALSFGYLGVPIFFVISGFVISFSIGSDTVTLKYFGNFILRRSIRLDITYWASIFLAIFLMFIKKEFVQEPVEYPDLTSLIAHMFYLQDILTIEPKISVIYWTLCLEVQFYLFFVVSKWVSWKLFYRSHEVLNLTILMVVGFYSVALDRNLIDLKVAGLFLSSWHYFLLGVLVSRVVMGHSKAVLLVGFWLVLEVGSQFVWTVSPYTLAAVFTSLLILGLFATGSLNSFLKNPVVTYLGTISYTLYLLHPDVGWKTISMAKRILPDLTTPFHTLLVLGLGVAVSIIAAHFFHVLFERPTQRLAASLKFTGRSRN